MVDRRAHADVLGYGDPTNRAWWQLMQRQRIAAPSWDEDDSDADLLGYQHPAAAVRAIAAAAASAPAAATRAEATTDGGSSVLQDILSCFICFERVKEPHMCPTCSKICCLSCISKWLTERRSQCPHCRAPLFVSGLVNCRFMEDVSHVQLSLPAPPPLPPLVSTFFRLFFSSVFPS